MAITTANRMRKITGRGKGGPHCSSGKRYCFVFESLGTMNMEARTGITPKHNLKTVEQRPEPWVVHIYVENKQIVHIKLVHMQNVYIRRGTNPNRKTCLIDRKTQLQSTHSSCALTIIIFTTTNPHFVHSKCAGTMRSLLTASTAGTWSITTGNSTSDAQRPVVACGE